MPSGDHTAVLTALSSMITMENLRSIARRDYGIEFEEHLEHLVSIWKTGVLPSPLEWNPGEVLELTRWGSPQADDRAGHMERAFACAVLLLSFADPAREGHAFGAGNTLAPFIESIGLLGGDLEQAAADMVAWIIPRMTLDNRAELAVFGVGLLYLALPDTRRWSDGMIDDVCVWIMEMENVEAGCSVDYGYINNSDWLLPHLESDIRAGIWKSLAREMTSRTPRRRPASTKESIELIAAMLA